MKIFLLSAVKVEENVGNDYQLESIQRKDWRIGKNSKLSNYDKQQTYEELEYNAEKYEESEHTNEELGRCSFNFLQRIMD